MLLHAIWISLLVVTLQISTNSAAQAQPRRVILSQSSIEFGGVVIGTASKITKIFITTEIPIQKTIVGVYPNSGKQWNQKQVFTVFPEINGALWLNKGLKPQLDFQCAPRKAGKVTASYPVFEIDKNTNKPVLKPRLITMKCNGVWRKTIGTLLKISQPARASPLKFGNITVGKSNTQTLVVKNTSAKNTIIRVRWKLPPIELPKQGGQRAPPRRVFDYSYIKNPWGGIIPRVFSVAGKSEIPIEIKFTPRRDSAYYGVLEVIRDSSNRIEIGLFGTGIEG